MQVFRSACAIAMAMAAATATPAAAKSIQLTPVVDGFEAGFVVDVVPVPGQPTKVFLVDFVAGAISVLDRDTGIVSPFLAGVTIDGTPIGATFFDSAAFSMAPAPDFQSSGKFYVSVNTTVTQNVVVEYTADPVALSVDPASQARVLTIEHPDYGAAEVHYGGAIRFGPDGYLWMTTGDIGAPFGPGDSNPAQEPQNRLGSVLRIDPSADGYPGDPNNNYAIPPGNPDFGPDSDPALVAIGLRNPFKGSFDPATGVFYIGEVGQLQREEIDVILPGPLDPLNFGWPAFEGTLPMTGGIDLPGQLTDPIFEMNRGGGLFEAFSITAGTVYRGPIAGLDGQFFFADFGGEDDPFFSPLWSFQFDPATGMVSGLTDWTIEIVGGGLLNRVLGFGTDGNGNLYVSDAAGTVYVVTAAAIPLPPALVPLATALLGLGALRRLRRS